MPEEYRAKSRLYLAGQLIDNHKNFWEPLLNKISSCSYINYLGEIKDDSEKIKILCDMDVIVTVSRDESCSLVTLEGAMLSKPLIVSENVGAKYIVSRDNGWIVKTGDVANLSKTFMEIIDNPQKLVKMGEISRKQYEALSNMESYKSDIVSMVETNLTDVTTYRLKKRKQTNVSLTKKAYYIYKVGGFRGLFAAYKRKKEQRNIMIPICLLGTGSTKQAIDLISGVRVEKMIGKCSLLSSEYPKRYSSLSVDISKMQDKHDIETDLSKTLVDALKGSNSKYLVIDLLDERFNLCRIKYAVGSEIVATKSNILMDNLGNISVDDTVLMSEYVSILPFEETNYERKICAVSKKIKGVFKRKNIILHECYLAKTYISKNGDILEFDEKTLANINRINDKLEKLYTVLKRELEGAEVIVMPDWVTADEKHKQGLNPMHYCAEYYKYVAKMIESYLQPKK